MSHLRITAGLGILVSWGWLMLCGVGAAQNVQEGTGEILQSNYGGWEQRILRANRGRLASYESTPQPLVAQPNSALNAAAIGDSSGVVMAEEMPSEDGYVEGASGCDSCEAACGDSCGACCVPGPCCLWQGLSIFTGVQGFKNPLDQGRTGTFGFHEGLNFGSPLDDRGLGYQIGFQCLQSNFMGDQTLVDANGSLYELDRHDQVFVTAGFFHRAWNDCGWQGGLVFDYLHDNYYLSTQMQQLRAELSFRFNWQQEIGYWGAYGVGADHASHSVLGDFRVASKDMHTFFYRRHYSGGAQTRLWTGFSGNSEWLLGGDAVVPLGSSWALENSFAYVLPKDKGQAGQEEECWSVMMRLVWYPGRCARQAGHAPYQPLLNVADNSTFIVNRE